jgi:hypothetical protein
MALLTRQAGSSAKSAASAYRSVNLLPAETIERNRASVVARRFVLAGLGLVVVGGGVWLAQANAINSAKDDLAAAEQAHAEARAELTPLQPVKAFSATLDQQQAVVGTAMATHTSFSGALDGFAVAWPAGSTLRTLDAKLGAGCAGPNPFAPAASIGCLTWTVTVPGEQQVRDLTANLETSPGLVEPYLTGAVRNEAVFDANGTANFDSELLTGRFADLLAEVAQ